MRVSGRRAAVMPFVLLLLFTACGADLDQLKRVPASAFDVIQTGSIIR